MRARIKTKSELLASGWVLNAYGDYWPPDSKENIIVPNMYDYLGQIVTLLKTNSHSYAHAYMIEGQSYYWSRGMIAEFDPKPKRNLPDWF